MNAPSLVLPADHPQRRALNDEVHARPPDNLEAPVRLSYLVLVGSGSRADDLAQLSELIEVRVQQNQQPMPTTTVPTWARTALNGSAIRSSVVIQSIPKVWRKNRFQSLRFRWFRSDGCNP